MKKILCVVAFMTFIHCGFTSSRVISTLYVLHVNQPAWAVGLVLSLYAFLPALLAIHVGKWIDSVGIRVPLFISILLIGLGCLFPIFLPYEKAGIWPIYVLCLLAGTGFLFGQITAQGLIGFMATNKNRATAFTFQSMGFSFSGSIGPVLAGYLIDKGSYQIAYSSSLALTILGGLFFFVLSPKLPASFNRGKVLQKAKRGAFDLLKLPIVRNILIASALVSMAWDIQAFMIPVYGTEIGLDAIRIGWLLSTFSICTFAVRVLMPILSNHFKEWQIILFVLLSAGTCYLIFPFVSNLFLLFVLCGWLGASLGASQPNVMSLLHQESPEGRLGEAIGIRTMLMNASHTALPLIFGFGGTAFGAAAAFWTMGVTMVGGQSWLRSSNKKHHIEDPVFENNPDEEKPY